MPKLSERDSWELTFCQKASYREAPRRPVSKLSLKSSQEGQGVKNLLEKGSEELKVSKELS